MNVNINSTPNPCVTSISGFKDVTARLSRNFDGVNPYVKAAPTTAKNQISVFTMSNIKTRLNVRAVK